MDGIATISSCVTVKSLKPDIVCFDSILKKVIILELTIPFKTNIKDAKNRKSKKYEDLISDIQENGFDAVYFTLEIGFKRIYRYFFQI